MKMIFVKNPVTTLAPISQANQRAHRFHLDVVMRTQN